MSEDTPRMPEPFGPRQNPDADSSERELDDALAEAASLAAELAEDVGSQSPTAAPGPARKQRAVSLTPEERMDLDSELTSLNRTVKRVSTELEGASSGPTKHKPKPPPAVPDFMAEFTQPPPADPRPPIDAARAPDASSPPDSQTAEGSALTSAPGTSLPDCAAVAQAATPQPSARAEYCLTSPKSSSNAASPTPGGVPLGVVGTAPPPLPQRLAAEQQTCPANSPRDADPPPATPGARQRLAARLYPMADGLVRVLERIDRPFDWISPGVKQAIGWFAIATISTAAVVAVIGLLG